MKKAEKILAAEFVPGGALERTLPGFEAREAQALLAARVEDILQGGGSLLAEAGTGVGKSLAYLVPGLKLALADRKPLLVSTATLTLQAQLLDKDIPAALKALGEDPEGARDYCVRAVGRSNYFCQLRFELIRGPKGEELLPDMPASMLDKLETWALSETELLREKLSFPVEPALWERANVDPYGCLGSLCPHARSCYFLKEKERLRSATLAVANHALVFADVQARRDGAAALPDAPRVIFDEAHHLERLASEHLGMKLSEADLERALDPVLDAKGKGMAARLGFPEGLAQGVREARQLGAELFRVAASGQAADFITPVIGGLCKTLKRLAGETSDEGLSAEIKAQAMRLERLGDSIRRWCGREGEGEGEIFWSELGPKGRGALLRSAPLKPGEAMAQELYPRFQSMVFTSATLATHQGLKFMKTRLGLPEDAEELVLSSPFDYASKAQLHLTRALPSPKPDEAAYFEGMEGALKRALALSRGRAFVLFTSFRHLEEMAGRLKDFVETQGWDFLKQGSGASRDKLLARFKKSGKAVLFGAQSFWEGVDVPGEALSCVILTRLPFAVPDTPLEKARSAEVEKAGGNAFFDLALPEAVLRLKQGFGRLIRHGSDEGFVHILDSRALNKSYGKAFLKALPKTRIFVDGEEAEGALN